MKRYKPSDQVIPKLASKMLIVIVKILLLKTKLRSVKHYLDRFEFVTLKSGYKIAHICI